MPVPRITSRTPLRDSILPAHRHTASLSYSSSLMAVLQPRKHRHRTTFIALFALFFLSLYLFVFQQSALSPTLALKRQEVPAAAAQMTLALESLRNHHDLHAHRKPTSHPLQLAPDQEIAAVSSFLASLPQNVIPPFVDPAHPIDPQLVLDFDTRSPRASDEVKQMIEDVWTRNPVFLYSKLYSPVSREVKTMIADLHLHPAPTIIDVDTRDDYEVLVPLVQRLASTDELPILLIGGRYVGPISAIRSLHQSGQLQQMITDAGAVIDGAKKKHKRK
ncbi:hypothetical protein BDZ89DRAFT_1027505 [Hymenopellis radicata]|nr:hypothetical protein BDZ89DRAFT_1027505 [Hymenopellis radicata]